MRILPESYSGIEENLDFVKLSSQIQSCFKILLLSKLKVNDKDAGPGGKYHFQAIFLEPLLFLHC